MGRSCVDGEAATLLLCCVVPPLVVQRRRGLGVDFLLAFELTLLGWLPGVMMAIYINYADLPPPSPSSDDASLPLTHPVPLANRFTTTQRQSDVEHERRRRKERRRRRRPPDSEETTDEDEETAETAGRAGERVILY